MINPYYNGMRYIASIIHYEKGPVFLHVLHESYSSSDMALRHIKHILKGLYPDGSGFQRNIQMLLKTCNTWYEINDCLERSWYDKRYTVHIGEKPASVFTFHNGID